MDTLAERTLLSQSYLSMIESNKREPTLSTIGKIAKALKVPVPIIMFLAAEKDDLKGVDAETSSRLSLAAMDVIRAL